MLKTTMKTMLRALGKQFADAAYEVHIAILPLNAAFVQRPLAMVRATRQATR